MTTIYKVYRLSIEGNYICMAVCASETDANMLKETNDIIVKIEVGEHQLKQIGLWQPILLE